MSRRAHTWFGLLLPSAALSCAEPALSPAKPPPPLAASSTTPALDVDAELAFVASVRELPALSALPVEIVPRAALLAAAEHQFDADAPADVLEARGHFLVMLGLAPQGFDFRAAILRRLRESLVGLYDPVNSRVLVAADIDAAATAMTRFHELAHGLVDQHFDLLSRLGYRADRADESSALSALAEGDANAVMLEATARALNIPVAELESQFLESLTVPPSTHDVPQVIWRMLTAPYSDGLKFVQALRARGGWPAVNAAWRNSPATSSEILHPERYPLPARAEPLALPAAPHAGCTLSYSEVLGEQTVRDLFASNDAERSSMANAFRADRLAMFKCRDGTWAILDVQHEFTPAGFSLRALMGKAASSCEGKQQPSALTENAVGSRLTLAPCANRAAP